MVPADHSGPIARNQSAYQFGPCSRCDLPLARRPVSLPGVVDRSMIVSLVAFPKDHVCACMAQLRSGPGGSECSSRAIVERNIRHSGEAA